MKFVLVTGAPSEWRQFFFIVHGMCRTFPKRKVKQIACGIVFLLSYKTIDIGIAHFNCIPFIVYIRYLPFRAYFDSVCRRRLRPYYTADIQFQKNTDRTHAIITVFYALDSLRSISVCDRE